MSNILQIRFLLQILIFISPFPLMLSAQHSKPNVIIIFTDDQGYADVDCFGAERFTTLNLDYIAPPLPLYENEKIIEESPDQRFFTRRFTEKSIRFIQQQKQDPFFLYLAHPMPHTPVHTSLILCIPAVMAGTGMPYRNRSVGEILRILMEEGIPSEHKKGKKMMIKENVMPLMCKRSADVLP